MNAKKTFIATLASVTAIASLAAVSVSAATPGASDSVASVDIEVVAGEPATGTVNPTDDLAVSVVIPADAITETVKFKAVLKVDIDAQNAIDNLDGVTVSASEILDLYFTDANDAAVDMTGKGVEVSIKTDKYNTVYLFDNGELQDMGAKLENGTLTFTAPRFATYVLANVEALVPSNPVSEPSNETPATSNPASEVPGNNTTNTGDNGFATTIAIFSIMAAVSLGTAVVATKAKKKSSK